MQDIKNISIQIEPSDKAISSFKDQIKKKWPNAVFITKPGLVSETLVYASDRSYKSWEKNGGNSTNRDKMFFYSKLEDLLLIGIPGGHSAIESSLWNIKSEMEKIYSKFGL